MELIIGIIIYILTAMVVVVVIGTIGFFVVRWLARNAKLIAACTLVVATFIAMFILLPPARAEELPDGFYYKVVFIDEVEEAELDRFDIADGAVAKFLLHTDDLDHIWDYWDVIRKDEEEFIDYTFNRELSNIAIYWVRENDIYVELDKKERITRGRIVVLTMWECDPDDPFDEEIVDVYYTQLITE